jgi:hypothetical protein
MQHFQSPPSTLHKMSDTKHFSTKNRFCAKRIGQKHGIPRYVWRVWLRGKQGLKKHAAVSDAFFQDNSSLRNDCDGADRSGDIPAVVFTCKSSMERSKIPWSLSTMPCSSQCDIHKTRVANGAHLNFDRSRHYRAVFSSVSVRRVPTSGR